jgi:hypothetical protein
MASGFFNFSKKSLMLFIRLQRFLFLFVFLVLGGFCDYRSLSAFLFDRCVVSYAFFIFSMPGRGAEPH